MLSNLNSQLSTMALKTIQYPAWGAKSIAESDP